MDLPPSEAGPGVGPSSVVQVCAGCKGSPSLSLGSTPNILVYISVSCSLTHSQHLAEQCLPPLPLLPLCQAQSAGLPLAAEPAEQAQRVKLQLLPQHPALLQAQAQQFSFVASPLQPGQAQQLGFAAPTGHVLFHAPRPDATAPLLAPLLPHFPLQLPALVAGMEPGLGAVSGPLLMAVTTAPPAVAAVMPLDPSAFVAPLTTRPLRPLLGNDESCLANISSPSSAPSCEEGQQPASSRDEQEAVSDWPAPQHGTAGRRHKRSRRAIEPSDQAKPEVVAREATTSHKRPSEPENLQTSVPAEPLPQAASAGPEQQPAPKRLHSSLLPQEAPCQPLLQLLPVAVPRMLPLLASLAAPASALNLQAQAHPVAVSQPLLWAQAPLAPTQPTTATAGLTAGLAQPDAASAGPQATTQAATATATATATTTAQPPPLLGPNATPRDSQQYAAHLMAYVEAQQCRLHYQLRELHNYMSSMYMNNMGNIAAMMSLSHPAAAVGQAAAGVTLAQLAAAAAAQQHHHHHHAPSGAQLNACSFQLAPPMGLPQYTRFPPQAGRAPHTNFPMPHLMPGGAAGPAQNEAGAAQQQQQAQQMMMWQCQQAQAAAGGREEPASGAPALAQWDHANQRVGGSNAAPPPPPPSTGPSGAPLAASNNDNPHSAAAAAAWVSGRVGG